MFDRYGVYYYVNVGLVMEDKGRVCSRWSIILSSIDSEVGVIDNRSHM